MDQLPGRQRVRVRPGRTQSLVGGIMGIVMLMVGLGLFSGLGGPFGFPRVFALAWMAVCVVITAISFYNAFSARGIAVYEVETDQPAAPTQPEG